MGSAGSRSCRHSNNKVSSSAVWVRGVFGVHVTNLFCHLLLSCVIWVLTLLNVSVCCFTAIKPSVLVATVWLASTWAVFGVVSCTP
jgi:hypothetical protein